MMSVMWERHAPCDMSPNTHHMKPSCDMSRVGAHPLEGMPLGDAGIKQLWQPAKRPPRGRPVAVQRCCIAHLACAHACPPCNKFMFPHTLFHLSSAAESKQSLTPNVVPSNQCIL
jgi:hypothetical protein